MKEAPNPFFEVQRRPLYTNWEENFGEYGCHHVPIPVGRDALINAENGKIVGVVAPKYKFVHNKVLADKITQMTVNMPIESMEDHLDGRTSRWVREILLTGDQFTYDMTGKNDIVKTKLRFFNGYDGKTSAGWSINAWRKICGNGMMGWRKLFGQTFAHLSEEIIEKFHRLFIEKHEQFGVEMSYMSKLALTPFSKEQYEVFVLTRELPDRTKMHLAGYYETAMNRWGEEETKWGVYNVLTAYATHETKARGGSNIFSAGYKQVDRVANEFLEWNPTPEEYNALKKEATETARLLS